MECEGGDWISLAVDRVQRWAAVNTIMDVRVPINMGNFSTRREMKIFRKELCSMKLIILLHFDSLLI
jgi:hypothetical protein